MGWLNTKRIQKQLNESAWLFLWMEGWMNCGLQTWVSVHLNIQGMGGRETEGYIKFLAWVLLRCWFQNSGLTWCILDYLQDLHLHKLENEGFILSCELLPKWNWKGNKSFPYCISLFDDRIYCSQTWRINNTRGHSLDKSSTNLYVASKAVPTSPSHAL